MSNLSNTKTSLSAFLRRKIIRTLAIAAVTLSFAIGVSFYIFSTSVVDVDRNSIVDLIAASLKTPLMQGSVVEVNNRIASLESLESVECISVRSDYEWDKTCEFYSNEFFNTTESRDLYFDLNRTDILGRVVIVFSNKEIIYASAMSSFLSIVILLCPLLLIFLMLEKTSDYLGQEFSRVLSIHENDGKQDFEIGEIDQMARRLKGYINRMREVEVAAAIAQTTQMLAHDVRKPFSMMEALIELIGDTNDPKEIKETMQENLPSVSHAIRSVNGMIQDVMEIGAESKLTVEPVNSRQFVSQVLRHQLQFRDDLEIYISYDLPEDLALNIDNLKFPRVFSNIVGNAIEHMKGKGKIWFKATSPSSGMSEFTIGNSNTYIPPEDVAKLFEAFFTKDKQGGTGLGLAIAKKIVEAHGGTIWCTSDQDAGTEFVFTIPCAIAKAIEPVNLPDTAQGYFRTRPMQKIEQQPEVSKEALEAISHSSVTLAIADDEAIYIDSLRGQIKKLSPNIPIVAYSTGIGLVESLASGKHPSIIILDADFGSGNISGFESCKLLRHSGYKGIICIHSNRGRLEYQPLAIEAGADYFVPKPMSKADLVNVIESNLTRGEAPIVSKKILLFEDEAIFQRRWKSKAKPKEVIAVRSWEEFINVHPDFGLESNRLRCNGLAPCRWRKRSRSCWKN